MRRAHAAGKHVHSWTIDDPAEMIELLDRGVDGLMTDRTDILKDVLVARGPVDDGAREGPIMTEVTGGSPISGP